MSWAIWITGPPGSGKSAITRRVAVDLRVEGTTVMVLELDEIRKVLTPSPTYSDAERALVYHALVYMATVLTESGVPVIIDATAHRRAWRERARTAIPRFAEIQLVCPLEVCRQREESRRTGHAPRHIYARAGQPGATVPGVDVPYEPAVTPDLTIDTSVEDVSTAAAEVVAVARRLALSSVAAPAGDPTPGARTPAAPAVATIGWAMWITGLPGSGKTTIAWSVADSLGAGGLRVRLLDAAAVRAALTPDGHDSSLPDEIVYRTIAYTAKLLTEAGIGVIIDAIAPSRAWRQMARALIAHFAEVQLVCPVEICAERERAVRWDLTGRPSPAPPVISSRAAPEIVLNYETALEPELVIYTDVQAPWTAADEARALAQRLAWTAAHRHNEDR
jgi:adenylylsulfate kinase